MLFLLNEQIMNGTVTMQVVSTGVEAEDFASTKKKVLDLEGFKKYSYRIDTDNDEELSFSFYSLNPFNSWGTIKNKPLKVI